MKKLSKVTRAKIETALKMRDEAEALLLKYCEPCPECCPPRHPCNPGEVIEEPDMIVSCDHCYGRGYMLPDDCDEEEE